jgi:hypothetical protein
LLGQQKYINIVRTTTIGWVEGVSFVGFKMALGVFHVCCLNIYVQCQSFGFRSEEMLSKRRIRKQRTNKKQLI